MLDCIAKQIMCWPYCLLWVIALLFFGAIFVLRMNNNIKHNRRTRILITFGVILILGTLLYYFTLSLSAESKVMGNELQLILVSILSSLELFIAQTHLYDGIISEVIFSRPLLLCTFITVYTSAILFSGVLLFKFITKRWDSQIWLLIHKKRRNNKSRKESHIFFGMNRYSLLLGKDILASRDIQNLIYIDFPGENENIKDLSLTDVLADLFKRKEDKIEQDFVQDDRVIILKAKSHLKEAVNSLINPMKFIALPKLEYWLNDSNNKVYVLSENEQDNISCLQSLIDIQAEVFCHARKEGIILQMEQFFCIESENNLNRIHIVDSTYLAVESLKRKENIALQPISFVDIAKDDKEEKLGYVTSAFNAMILGFGETGQEMFKFLYEFGAFVKKDQYRSDYSFRIFDSELHKIKGAFLNQHPSLINNNSIIWEENTINKEGKIVDSQDFWEEYEQQLPRLNYVVVAMGDDRTNAEIGVKLMKFYLQNKETSQNKFIILVRLSNAQSQYAKMLHAFNDCYCGNEKRLIGFGDDETIWKYDYLTRLSLQKEAEHYFEAYQKASGEPNIISWADRQKDILGLKQYCKKDPNTDEEIPQFESEYDYQKYKEKRQNKLSNLLELTRKQDQDYANCLHSMTKLQLCDCRLYDSDEYANKIPEKLTDKTKEHYPAKDHTYNVLMYLAIGEHIRWVASHEILGCYYHKKRNELLKRIEYMIPYHNIEDTPWDWKNGERVQQVRHFDWIVVKTTLLLEAERRKLPQYKN